MYQNLRKEIWFTDLEIFGNKMYKSSQIYSAGNSL